MNIYIYIKEIYREREWAYEKLYVCMFDCARAQERIYFVRLSMHGRLGVGLWDEHVGVYMHIWKRAFVSYHFSRAPMHEQQNKAYYGASILSMAEVTRRNLNQ